MSDARPGLRDVARLAGVSLSSASRALSEHTSASPRLRARVQAAARELGYEPNLLAQSLSRGATGLIGFMVREIQSPGVPPVLHGAEATLREAGYALVFATAEGRSDLAADYLRVLRQRRMDGLVMVLTDADDPAIREQLERLDVPCVLYDSEVDWLDASSVLYDQASSAQEAASTLARLGHRHLAFVAGRRTMRTTAEVEAGLRAGLAEAGAGELHVEAGDFTFEHGHEATRRLLLGPEPPTALIAGNAQLAHGIISALRELGLRPGRDVSLVCAEEPPTLLLLDPPVAAIRWDYVEVGATLARLLLRRLDGGPAERAVVPTTFVPGETCTPPPSVA